MPMKRKKTLLCAAALLLAAAVCISIDSKYNLELTEYTLGFERLPANFEGFKIVQLSDLHGMSFGKDNSRLVKLVAEQEPDIIVLTGDMAENEKQLRALESLMRGISDVAPVYYVSGNHEFSYKYIDEVRALMEKWGAESLENEYKQIFRGGEAIVIAGVDDPNGRADMIKPDALAARIRGEYPEDFVLWLGHRNYWVERYPGLPVDLVLISHAHGGIVRLPFIGGLFSTAHGLMATYEKGLYEGDEFIMAVSRGLGNSVPAPRFLNRPEIVSIILEKK